VIRGQRSVKENNKAPRRCSSQVRSVEGADAVIQSTMHEAHGGCEGRTHTAEVFKPSNLM